MPGPLIGPDPDVPRWRSSLEALSLLGTNQSKSRTCLGGCIMLVESRRVSERRLRPQTGCLVQRLSCYPGECRHGDSAAPRRRTLHRQVSCRLRKPDWRPCTQPGWSGGRGRSRQSRQSRPGPGEIEDDDRQHPPGRGHGDLPVGRCAQREAFRSASSVRSSRGRHLYSNLLPGPETLAELRDRASARLRAANHASVRQVQHRLARSIEELIDAYRRGAPLPPSLFNSRSIAQPSPRYSSGKK
jgi:hypothetical protein